MKFRLVLFYLAISVSGSLLAQGPTMADYKRAVAYQWGNLINIKVFNIQVQPIWFDDSTGLGFISQDKTRRSFSKYLWKQNRIEP